MRNKWKQKYGEAQLAGFEVNQDPKMGKGLWEWISTQVMARGNFEKGRRSLQNAIGLFKRFFKRNFPNEKHLVLSPNKKGKPPRPKIKSWVNPNKTFVIKEIF